MRRNDGADSGLDWQLREAYGPESIAFAGSLKGSELESNQRASVNVPDLMVSLEVVPLGLLDVSGTDQTRAQKAPDRTTVAKYARMIADGVNLGAPLAVRFEDRKLHVADGHHRLAALGEARGLDQSVLVEVVAGGGRELRRYSWLANSKHGLGLRIRDAEDVLVAAIRDREHWDTLPSGVRGRTPFRELLRRYGLVDESGCGVMFRRGERRWRQWMEERHPDLYREFSYKKALPVTDEPEGGWLTASRRTKAETDAADLARRAAGAFVRATEPEVRREFARRLEYIGRELHRIADMDSTPLWEHLERIAKEIESKAPF